MNTCIATADRGTTLPLVMVGLAIVALVAVAGFDASRFALAAARAQASSAAALHAADSALEVYLSGAGPPEGPLTVQADPGLARLSVTRLARLADSSWIASLVVVGEAPAGAPRPVTRQLKLVVRVDSLGTRRQIRGSWQEKI